MASLEQNVVKLSKDLIVGINGNLEHLRQILDDDSSKYIREVFVAAPHAVANTGRIGLEDVSMQNLKQIAEMCKAKGVEVNAIVNSENKNVVGVTNFARMAYDVGVTWLTVTDPTIVMNVAHKVPEMNINLSVYARVTHPLMAMEFVDMGVKRVNLPQYLNRDPEMIKRVVDYIKPKGATVELYVNSKCVSSGYCPMAISHRNWKMERTPDQKRDPFLAWCTGRRKRNPLDNVFVPLIRPEDKHFYDDLGIEHYKIASRTDTPERTIQLVRAWGERHFEGQFHELWSNVFSGESFDNRLLDGFYEGVMHLPEEQQKEKYLEFAKKYIYKGERV